MERFFALSQKIILVSILGYCFTPGSMEIQRRSQEVSQSFLKKTAAAMAAPAEAVRTLPPVESDFLEAEEEWEWIIHHVFWTMQYEELQDAPGATHGHQEYLTAQRFEDEFALMRAQYSRRRFFMYQDSSLVQPKPVSISYWLDRPKTPSDDAVRESSTAPSSWRHPLRPSLQQVKYHSQYLYRKFRKEQE